MTTKTHRVVTIDEILSKYASDDCDITIHSLEQEKEGEELLKRTKSSILKTVLTALPEKNPTIFGGVINNGHDCYSAEVKGFNSAIDDVRQRIERLFS